MIDNTQFKNTHSDIPKAGRASDTYKNPKVPLDNLKQVGQRRSTYLRIGLSEPVNNPSKEYDDKHITVRAIP